MAITFNPNPMTELEAVNSMLMSIGKAPVNTLAIAGINDVSVATTKLYDVTREVQSRGWWFNREPNYPMTPDSLGNVLIPNTCVSIDIPDRTFNVVERQGKLYDVDHHTFDLRPLLNGHLLKANLVWCFEFEEIPHVVRSYIARRAGREFQTSAVGSQILYQFTKEMELEAETNVQRFELKNGSRNMFTSQTRTNMARLQPRIIQRTF